MYSFEPTIEGDGKLHSDGSDVSYAVMSIHPTATRRSFVKRFTLGIAASSIVGRAWKFPFLAELQAADVPTQGIVLISLEDFPALANLQSSVRIGINPVSADHFPDGNFYPILINRDLLGNLHVLNSECRHASCVVDPFDDSEQGLYCPCHHSLYGMDGQVIRGPASRNLRKYAFQMRGETILRIVVPGLGFTVTPALTIPSIANRFRLTFKSEPMVDYEVQFKPKLGKEWQGVAFSLDEAGPADLTSVLGQDRDLSVFVDRTSDAGFYQIVMKVNEV